MTNLQTHLDHLVSEIEAAAEDGKISFAEGRRLVGCAVKCGIKYAASLARNELSQECEQEAIAALKQVYDDEIDPRVRLWPGFDAAMDFAAHELIERVVPLAFDSFRELFDSEEQ